MLHSLALMLHVFGVVIWVGGMFFAYMALRPAATNTLEPPQRLSLWAATFGNFFPWVWISIIGILLSGYFIIGQIGGFSKTMLYIHVMHGLGLLMMLLFFHVFFAPYKRLKNAVAAKDWAAGGKALAQIRWLVAANLTLGLITIIIATAGRSFLQ